MPIKFRCQHCDQLMSIATRKAGTITVCPRCAHDTQVPDQNAPDAQEQVQPQFPISKFYSDQSENAPAIKELFVATNSQQLASISNDDEEDEELDFEIKRADTEFDELDMTPMVDVTFLLLIFFMVTASFSIQKSIEIPPPDPDQQGAAQTVQPLEEMEETSILVEIDEENRFFVESEPVNDPRDLPTILAEVRSRDSKYEVIVSVDERTHHEAVVTAIDAAQEVGMQRIRWGVNSSE